MEFQQLIERFANRLKQENVVVRPIGGAPWLAEVEAKLSARLPRSFSTFIDRYAFAPFEAGTLSFFGTLGHGDSEDMSVALFADPNLAKSAAGAGYLFFARPADGSYDPVCFDTNIKSQNREFPIVRLDHEAVLQQQRIAVVEQIAPSFLRLMEEILAGSIEVRPVRT
jgi:hypothetical protein